MKKLLKKHFPNLYGFPNWNMKEVGCFLILVMFAVIGLIYSLIL